MEANYKKSSVFLEENINFKNIKILARKKPSIFVKTEAKHTFVHELITFLLLVVP